MKSQKMKKLLVNAAMAGMIAGAGVMVPTSGTATAATHVSQISGSGRSKSSAPPAILPLGSYGYFDS